MNDQHKSIVNGLQQINENQKEQTLTSKFIKEQSIIGNHKIFSKKLIKFNENITQFNQRECNHNNQDLMKSMLTKLLLKPITIVQKENNNNVSNSQQVNSVRDMTTTIKNNEQNNHFILPMLTNSKSLQCGLSLNKNNMTFRSVQLFQTKSLSIRVFAIYKRVDYPILINPKIIVQSFRQLISSLLNLSIEVMELKHKKLDLMSSGTDNAKVYDIVLKSMHPFFEVRKISMSRF